MQYALGMLGTMASKTVPVLMIVAMTLCGACGKVQDKLLDIDPLHVGNQFFETWKKQDWKALYRMADPAFIQKLRTQKLPPELMRMSDEELFIHEFTRVQGLNPDREMKTYRIEMITPYQKGDTTVWMHAVVNGRKKKIPMTLDGLSLKIDLTRIE